MNKIKKYGINITKKKMHIGNKNINLIFYNGNIKLKIEKLMIKLDKNDVNKHNKNKKKDKNYNKKKIYQLNLIMQFFNKLFTLL